MDVTQLQGALNAPGFLAWGLGDSLDRIDQAYVELATGTAVIDSTEAALISGHIVGAGSFQIHGSQLDVPGSEHISILRYLDDSPAGTLEFFGDFNAAGAGTLQRMHYVDTVVEFDLIGPAAMSGPWVIATIPFSSLTITSSAAITIAGPIFGGTTAISTTLSGTVTTNGAITIDTSVINTTTVTPLSNAGQVTVNGVLQPASFFDPAFMGTGSLPALETAMRGNDSVLGMADSQRLYGFAGNDTLAAGGGGALLYGGAGNDVYDVTPTSLVFEPNLPFMGTDLIRSAASWTLGADFENLLLTGSANAQGIGNAYANQITGNSGDNDLQGGTGADALTGGAGNDSLVGGTVAVAHFFQPDRWVAMGGSDGDTMRGGAGDDFYTVTAVGRSIWVPFPGGERVDTGSMSDRPDQVIELANEGSDTVIAYLTYTLPANVENLKLDGLAVNGTGNALNNALTGNSYGNLLLGLAGNDLLDGGYGADTLDGGLGNDTYAGSPGNDLYLVAAGDSHAGGIDEGLDTVKVSVATSPLLDISGLPGLEDIIYTGAVGAVLKGNDSNNALTSGPGKDTMVGGEGDDTYFVNSAADVVIELGASTGDTVVTNASFTLGAGSAIENLTLAGTALNAVGNGIANVLTGNEGANSLDGMGGADTLRGGNGSDTYVVDDAGDAVEESAPGTFGGVDLVKSGVSWTLGADFENLTLTGIASNNGYGNASANKLTGNDGDNLLDGGAGRDTMAGGLGNDIYVVDVAGETTTEALNAGTDTVRASVNWTLGANVERLELTGALNLNGTGNALANRLAGNDGNNSLSGLAGADTYVASLGDDTYVIADAGDSIDASGGDAGVDTARVALAGNTYLDLSGKAWLENAVFTGLVAASLVGNASNNSLTGSVGNDTLDGGLGADVMNGGAGDDSYVVDDAGDVIIDASGIDTVITTSSATLAAGIERLTLAGGESLAGTGNAGANTITGNAADNLLAGLAGNDSLAGGGGNDTLDGGGGIDRLGGGGGDDVYFVDIAFDSVVETADAGSDRIIAAVSLTLAANVETLELAGAANLNGTGNAGANSIVGNTGNNLLDGKAGIDFLYGGGGNDVLVWDAADAVVDGGAGFDTLRVDGAGVALDLRGNASLQRIEAINLTGSGNNSLVLREADVVAMTPAGILRVEGNSGDAVNLGEGWTLGGTQAIGANSYRSISQGAATLLVDTDVRVTLSDTVAVADAIPLSGNRGIDGLVQGGAWQFYGPRTLTYSLNINDNNMDPPGPGIGGEWSAEMAEAMERAFDAWGALINVHFERIESGEFYLDSEADLAVILTGNELGFPTLGVAFFPDPRQADEYLEATDQTRLRYPDPEGDIAFDNYDAVFNNVAPGSAGFMVMLHEIGHALGLKHGTDDGGNDRPNLPGNLTGFPNTLMVEVVPMNGPYPETPLLSDVRAIQHIYGANTAYNLGNDTYVLGASGAAVGEIQVGNFAVIWDSGGTDTLRLTQAFASPIVVRGGSFLFPGSRIALGDGVVIERVIGSPGNDSISGYVGSDYLDGAGGNDRLTGGAGADSFAFTTALNATSNRDTITDFVSGVDRIVLDDDIFTQLTAGGAVGDRIVYTGGTLYYDADGAGGAAGVAFAVLTGSPVVLASDYEIVA